MAKPIKEDKNPNSGKKELNTSSMLVITTGIISVVVIVCILVMYLLLDSSFDKKLAKLAPDDQEQMYDEDEEEPDLTKQEGVLLDLGDFVLNLADTASRRYIKVVVALELSKTRAEIEAASDKQSESKGGHGESGAEQTDDNTAIIAEMERYKPIIRDSIISVLSNKTSDELSTAVGKEIAKDEITEAVNGIFDNRRKVIRVSFGQFIIQ